MQNEPWQSPDTESPNTVSQTPYVPPQQPPVNAVQEAAASPQPIQPASATPSATENVWISKDEYERLRQAEITQVQAQLGTATIQKRPIGGLLIATLAISALVFIAGLLNPAFMTMAGFGLVMLVVSAAFSLNDYLKAKKEGFFRSHKTRNRILFILTLVVVAMPVLAIVGMILFLVVMCGVQSCRGS